MNKRQRKKWLKKQGLYINPREMWNLNVTLAKYIFPRLKLYKKLTIAYPIYGEADTFEKWHTVLDKMIWSFEQVANYYDGKEWDFDMTDPLWKEKLEAMNKRMSEGLMLFAKFFTHLGW